MHIVIVKAQSIKVLQEYEGGKVMPKPKHSLYICVNLIHFVLIKEKFSTRESICSVKPNTVIHSL